MKKFKLIYVLIGLMFLGCSKETVTTIGQQGDYLANFDFPDGVPSAPAKLVLINRSKNADKFHWEFVGGKVLNKTGIVDVSESEKLAPDTILYQLPGEYTIKLTTWQGDKMAEMEKKITLKKMTPKIVVPANVGVFKDVQFDARAFSYPGKAATYSWDFGIAGTSTLKNPIVNFTIPGPYLVKLKVNDGVEEFSTELTIEVKGELAKSIYFTDVITKKIYKIKLTTLSPQVVVDLGIATGASPLGLSVTGDKLFYSEAGLGLRFSSGAAALPDGYLKSFNLDGSGEKLITKSLTPLTYNMDPWMHAVDKDGNIWWTSRNNGVYVINSSASEATYPAAKFVSQGAGFSSASHFYSGIKEVNNEIWVSYSGPKGVGILRYTKAGAIIAPLPGIISTLAVRQFVIDKVNQRIYFAINRTGTFEPGIYRSDMEGNNVVPIYNDAAVMGFSTGTPVKGFSDQGFTGGLTDETIYVTGMDIDEDEVGKGYLYFGYRHRADASGTNAPQTVGSGSQSGIMRYKLDGTAPVDFLLKGYAPYGLAIDQIQR
ncbi:PKD domain-containing protein [Pedobacter hiemivivus]|uniref:PKD domain-containing protein n=1 Tax=Pedobacter hiemivivus TaxID=2530454 RepID=A0A4R0MDA7_9SPHI|nr:PKD domain-containing protein [Pedobacter hiemivivus]TCC83762.1 PKD domain-containing protein [Pedobacter hiemivivus]